MHRLGLSRLRLRCTLSARRSQPQCWQVLHIHSSQSGQKLASCLSSSIPLPHAPQCVSVSTSGTVKTLAAALTWFSFCARCGLGFACSPRMRQAVCVVDSTNGYCFTHTWCVCQVVSGTIKKVGSSIGTSVPTIRTDADVATWREVRFICKKKACQSHIANLRMLKLNLAIETNQNPHCHL